LGKIRRDTDLMPNLEKPSQKSNCLLKIHYTYVFVIMNKNSSGDEIANVLVNDDIAHT